MDTALPCRTRCNASWDVLELCATSAELVAMALMSDALVSLRSKRLPGKYDHFPTVKPRARYAIRFKK